MRPVWLISAAVFVILGAGVLSTFGCSQSPGTSGNTGVNSPAPSALLVNKVKVSVESVNAITSGAQDKYYVILEVTIKNDGADGIVVLMGTVTQGTSTMSNELPIYITHGTKEVVPLVFPLKWKGGDYTQHVEIQVP